MVRKTMAQVVRSRRAAKRSSKIVTTKKTMAQVVRSRRASSGGVTRNIIISRGKSTPRNGKVSSSSKGSPRSGKVSSRVTKKTITKSSTDNVRKKLMDNGRLSSLKNIRSARSRLRSTSTNRTNGRKMISPRDFAMKKFNQYNKGKNITWKTSFTVAVPVGRKKEKVILQDYHFYFNNNKLIDMKKFKNKVPYDKDDFERRTGVKIYV